MGWVLRYTFKIDQMSSVMLYQNATKPLLLLVYNDGINNVCSAISNGNVVALRLNDTMQEYFAYEVQSPQGYTPLQIYAMAIQSVV